MYGETSPFVMTPNGAYPATAFFGVTSVDTAVADARPTPASGFDQVYNKAQAHPLAVLIGVVGGIALYMYWHGKG